MPVPHPRPHLLLCGWHVPGTGFTRVLQALVPFLAQRYRITWVGVGYRGPPFHWCPDVEVIPTNLRGGDMMGAYAARLDWDRLQPDLVLVLNDLWYLPHYTRQFADLRGQVPLVGYLPLDGALDRPEWADQAAGFDQLITYTQWAAAQLRAALAERGLRIPVTVAGHGVDRQGFQASLQTSTLQTRMQSAAELFGLEAPAFVVLNASRPDPRKRLDLTLEAFAGCARDLPPQVYLCLHQAIAHEQYVEPLRAQVRALGIAERILWHPPHRGPLDDAGLNRLYNACAVGLNTAMGEGFGLVSFEHAATGAPQVLPALPALLELWGNAAECIPVRPIRTEHSPLLMGEVSVPDVTQALQRLYRDPAHWTHRAAAAYARATAADLDWSVPAHALLDALAQVRVLPVDQPLPA